MGNRDINLFKAAGGDRAKGGKASSFTYMVIFTIAMVVIAIGVMVFFNVRANNAERDYQAKQVILSNYQNTKLNLTAEDADGVSLAEEYAKVRDDIAAAAVINSYVDDSSALYPKALPAEIDAVKTYILSQNIFSINEPVTDEEGILLEEFTPNDYEALAESLYEDGTIVLENRELYYYALKRLAAEQEEAIDEGKWYTYFRGYMLMVFTSEVEGISLTNLCKNLADNLTYSSADTHVTSPFSSFEMLTDELGNEYSPFKKPMTKNLQHEDGTATTYHMILMPMKSAIERAVDELEYCASEIRKNSEVDDPSLYTYELDAIHFTNEQLEFELIIANGDSFTPFKDALKSSLFFKIDNRARADGRVLPDLRESHTITLQYKYIEYATEE